MNYIHIYINLIHIFMKMETPLEIILTGEPGCPEEPGGPGGPGGP